MFAAGVKLGCIVEATEQIENITLEKQPISPIGMLLTHASHPDLFEADGMPLTYDSMQKRYVRGIFTPRTFSNVGTPAPDRKPESKGCRKDAMLHYAIIFLIIALIAAFFGFAGIAGTSAWIAQILFLIFLVLFVISLVFRGRPPV
jgi:uncharacterized membrane protein YtjA (UPF0391 family)